MILKDEFYCIGSEVEIKKFQRELAIHDKRYLKKYSQLKIDAEKLAKQYSELNLQNKKIVHCVLNELNRGKDFFGYNMDRFLRAYQQATPQISQLKMSRQILIDMNYIFDSKYVAKKNQDNYTDKLLNNVFDMAKKTITLTEDKDGTKGNLESYIHTICDYFLISIDLLKQGVGQVYEIKDKWFDRYINDSTFWEIADKDRSVSWNTRLHIETYEKYLREKGELGKNESILEERWAVITYSGAFLILVQQKRTSHEAKAVKCLIEKLHEQQERDKS